MPGILVIRGGAIGDFILTLPAIALLREAFPSVPLEILGYKHIVSLAEGRYYAHATRSIEYAGLASFFVPGGPLPEDLVSYFAGFSQIISYLYDPDGFFEANLRRAGVKNLISANFRVEETAGAGHAVRQLARPLESMALYLEPEPAAEEATVHPGPEDRAWAEAFLPGGGPVIALHPGSGGKHKLWPLEHWRELLERLRALENAPTLLLIDGEADAERLAALLDAEPVDRPGSKERVAWNLPLPLLAAVLERCSLFVGHDSGISHLAAAVKTPSLLLFGPTDPAIWAPAGNHVQAVRAPGGSLMALSPSEIFDQLSKILIIS